MYINFFEFSKSNANDIQSSYIWNRAILTDMHARGTSTICYKLIIQ